ncbi:hypothetical protein L2X98_30475 [Microbacterium elymi]|uniref:Uncharacterized protein n=1 Tax=Microbacterium elymi TaxID=2909587 RepID=A0ABY5NHY7_9MICO|nr:hypothetical protein [Microbacterium elymi]UUT34780.1 hypothetical protein L2X98_30475 [Microbacterium elymi]
MTPEPARARASRVSGTNSTNASVATTPSAARVMKSARHPQACAIAAPTAGATIGAMPVTTDSIPIREAVTRSSAETSRTTLRATTIPAAPNSPVATRTAMRMPADGASALARDAAVQPIAPISVIGRRPYRSLSGPQASCRRRCRAGTR